MLLCNKCLPHKGFGVSIVKMSIIGNGCRRCSFACRGRVRLLTCLLCMLGAAIILQVVPGRLGSVGVSVTYT
jgi:hypothetical protein